MVVDTSAIVAVVTGERRAADLSAAMAASKRLLVSPMTRLEAAIVLSTRLDIAPVQAEAVYDEFIEEVGAVSVVLSDDVAREAVQAYSQYGKGRHPARLTLADCVAYAIAKAEGASLLFVGHDFARTDAQSALADPSP
ncbi:type II toxin-antitoxin system VapC family toxin [Chthonobacter albigriseus]|uniref:type II toxin-antitoxin system VapC family toxin n=1 Tax=Chthonobacter albigriseus TaxID=1683161 RepID=UPI0015EE54A1|nr:type II toxin-antitoxin system VapC family toxin [Chthonobacter albigriseus]